MLRLTGVILVLLAACGGPAQLYVGEPIGEDAPDPQPDDDTEGLSDDSAAPEDSEAPAETEEPEEPEVDPFLGAQLIVTSPVAGEVYDDGTRMVPFDGYLVGPDGSELAFEGIRWTLVGGDELLVGNTGDVRMPWGLSSVEVEAALPNGYALRNTVGAIRVQSPRTGIYVGGTTIIASLSGLPVPLNASCAGTLSFEVDLAGRRISGDGACGLAFVGAQLNLDLNYDFTGDVTDPSAAGDLLVDTGLIGLPMPWTGRFQPRDNLAGTFEGFGLGLFGYSLDLTGTFTATRVSRYLGP